MKPVLRFNLLQLTPALRRWAGRVRRFAIVGASAVWAAAALANGAERGADEAPRFSAAALEIDLGRVRGGEVAEYRFVFTNTGAATLELSLVKSSCGCLAVGDYSQSVEPGQTGEVPLELQTVNYSGDVAETLVFSSNDPAAPTVTLHVKASVWWPVEVSPQAAVFDVIPGSPSAPSATVRITNHLPEAITLSAPASSQPWLAIELVTNQPGRAFTLTLKATPPSTAGNLFGRVTLITSSAEVPALEIPVYALIRPAVTVMPPRLAVPGLTLTNPLSQSVSIRNASTNALTLSDPRANAAGVEVGLREVVAGRLYRLTATFPAGFTANPEQQLQLSVRSSHPQHPEIRIPIEVLTNTTTPGEK